METVQNSLTALNKKMTASFSEITQRLDSLEKQVDNLPDLVSIHCGYNKWYVNILQNKLVVAITKCIIVSPLRNRHFDSRAVGSRNVATKRLHGETFS